MEFRTYSSPHLPVSNSVPVMMLRVLLALIPGTVCAFWLFGWGILVNILLAGITSLAAEAAVLAARKRPVLPALLDGSALVTAVLLALALPPLTPWWIPVTGSLFAIVIAKQLYGGLGYNPFNPAMAGYVMLLISFPLELTLWTAPGEHPGLMDTLALLFTGSLPDGTTLDALTMATPIDSIKTRLGLNETLSEIQGGPLFGSFAGAGWEWINLWFLLGGLWLLQMKVIQWQSRQVCWPDWRQSLSCFMPSTRIIIHHHCSICLAALPCCAPFLLQLTRSRPAPHHAVASTMASVSAC
jgi:electron transport complex protein RnfD